MLDRARTPRRRRSLRAAAGLTVLLLLACAAVVAAATPVEHGFRGKSIGGGVNRATSDKPQSKLWFTDGQWFAGMFDNGSDAFRIHRLDDGSKDWETGAGLPVIDARNSARGDHLWHESSQTLWVASGHPTDAVEPFADDSIKVVRFGYDAAANAYTLESTATIPGTQTTTTAGEGGTMTVTIARDSTGRLWTVWPKSTELRFSFSDDGGATWSQPAQVPTQAGNPIKIGDVGASDIGAVFSFESNIGIIWTDHSETGAAGAANNGFYFTSIAAGSDPTVSGNWTAAERLPSLAGADDAERADNHINVKVASDGTIYAVGKTGKDTADCATSRHLPLVPLFRRTTAGDWSAHLVSTGGDCNSRGQLALSNQLGVVYVLLTSPNGGGAIYVKSAPMGGPEALRFRETADTSIQRGTPFIRSATETKIDDASTTKQSVTSTSGLVALATNVNPEPRSYLHNRWNLAASDATAPSGTVSIDAGAAGTTSTTVSVATPATDAGSGVSLVRLADTGATDGDGLLSDASARTFSYATPRNWTIPGGDGVKTVYVQWRDAAGNWSAVASDTIRLDTTGPTGSVAINGGAASTNVAAVTVGVSATDPSGVTQVRLSNFSGTTDGLLTTGTTFTYASGIPWTLQSGEGTRTVYVQWRDALGNWSSVASDSILLSPPDTTYTAVSPVRLLDTRVGNPSGIGPFRHGEPQTIQITGRAGIPSNAVAITGNLTVVGQTRRGFVSLGPTMGADPSTSTINFPLGDTRANGVIVPLSTTGKVAAVYRAAAGEQTHLLLDVTGYFVKGTGAARYVPLTPARFLDTRVGNPAGAAILQNGVPYGFKVGGRTVGGVAVPADAVAITGNLTVTGQTAKGYLSLTPAPTSSPTTSTLNFPTNDTRANNVVAPLGTNGNLYVVYKGSGRAHAILDVTGYFRAGASGLTYVPLAPTRIIDTRIDLGITNALIDDVPKGRTMRNAGGIASDADAFTGNLTVTGQTHKGYVSVTPTANPNPTTSTINFPVGDTRANGVAGKIDDTTGRSAFVYKASSGTTHIILDVTGYFH